MKMIKTISNSDDMIDLSDVIARIEELSGECANEDYAEELAALESLAEEAKGCADWQYGETLIRDSYFKTYAQDLAEDIGAIDRDATWPNTHIDWDAAAEELQMEYTSVDFGGVEYWIR